MIQEAVQPRRDCTASFSMGLFALNPKNGNVARYVKRAIFAFKIAKVTDNRTEKERREGDLSEGPYELKHLRRLGIMNI